MLHIILTILKVIGIIAALILLLILLVGCSVLFVPIRYKITGKKRECDLESEVKISWMFRMLSVEMHQKKKVKFTIKICGKTLEQWKEKINKIKRKKQITSDTFEEKEEPSQKKEVKNEVRKVFPENSSETEETGQIERIEQRTENLEKEIKEEKEYEETKKGTAIGKRIADFPKRVRDKIKAMNCKIKKLWKNLKRQYRGIKNSLTKIKETVCYYYTLFQEERTKQAIQFCKVQLIWIIKKISPKKIKGEIQFGTGDPATTGEIMGLFSVFLPIYSYDLQLNPDFENKILEGDIELTGSIQGWYFLILAWRFFRNKEIKYVMKKIKR